MHFEKCYQKLVQNCLNVGLGMHMSKNQFIHASGINLVLTDGLATDEVTKEAFEILGENGMIQAADQGSCSECTHKDKGTPDIISDNDPAALVGVDEDTPVPALVGGHNIPSEYAILEQGQNATSNT